MSTSNLNHPDNDLDPAERADARQVRESYRAALQEEPRAMIDDAIRAAARRATAAGQGTQVAGAWNPMSTKKGWGGRWATPLAAAATVVLTSSVVFMAVQDSPDITSSVLPSTANVTAQKASGTGAPAVLPPVAMSSLAAPSFAATNDTKPKAPAAKVGPQSGLGAVAPSPKAALPPQATPSLPQKSAQPSVNVPIITPTKTPTLPQMQIAGDAGKPINLRSQSITSKAEITSSNSVNREAAFSPSNEQRSRSSEEARLDAGPNIKVDGKSSGALLVDTPVRMMASPPVAIAPAPAPLAPRAADSASVAKKQGAPEATASVRSSITAEPKQLANAELPAPEPQRFSATKISKDANIEPAEAWIKRMLELKRQDRIKELAEEISRFRKRYPDATLPKELTAAQN